MIHLANLLIAADDSPLAQELLRKIRRHGYEGRIVSSLEAACATASQEHPDAVLASDVSGADSLGLAKALKSLPGCSEIPVCVIAQAPSPEFRSAALAAGVDDLLSPPVDETKLVARLRPLVRLSIMCAELHRRSATAKEFGAPAEASTPSVSVDSDYPLLIVGKPRAEDIGGGLAKARLTIAADPTEADGLLADGNFDAAVMLPSGDPAPYLDLCAHIRNNPRLFNLPIVVVADPDQVGESVAYHHGASGFYQRPLQPLQLEAAVLMMVRRQRLRWAIREALGRTLQQPTRDAATGVYSRAFLDSYLGARVAYATSHGRHLTVMFFRAPEVEDVRRRFGAEAGNHLRLQVAQWITSLLRGEDLTARYEEDEFCVVLPDTPQEEAEVVMNRIAGVLAYTDFAVKDVYQPVKVWVRAGAADMQPGDTVDRLVARARRTPVAAS
jgi:two-component system, cell cycle response regulator